MLVFNESTLYFDCFLKALKEKPCTIFGANKKAIQMAEEIKLKARIEERHQG